MAFHTSMKKSLLHLALWLACWQAAPGQHVDLRILGSKTERLYLSAVSGEHASRIDSFPSASPGNFSFRLGAPLHPAGQYRLTFEQGRWLDLLVDGEDVVMQTVDAAVTDSLSVLSSPINKTFHAFLRLHRDFKTKSDLLQVVVFAG